MTDEKTEETKAEEPKAKPRINHGEPHVGADSLVKALVTMVAGNPGNPAQVIQWLDKAPIADVRIACLRAMTAPWSVACEPLVDSLTDDQARGTLCAIIVAFYQGMNKGKALNNG